MPSKQQVIDLHRANPSLTSGQIAAAILGSKAKDFQQLVITDGWVRATAQRANITLGKRQPRAPKPPRKPRQDSVAALGHACRALGLTVADLRALSANNR